jgi:hypothetical protein
VKKRNTLFLVYGMVSAVTSIAVSLGIGLALRPPSMAETRANSKAETIAPEENPKDLDGIKKTLAKEIKANRTLLTSIRMEAQVNARKVVEPEKAPEPSDKAPEKEVPISDDEKIRKIIKALLAITEPGRGHAARRQISKIIDIGDPAVPMVAEALALEGDHDDWGRFFISGNVVRSYPHLRCALIDALCRIGTPKAQKAAFKTLEKARSIREVTTTLVALKDCREPWIVQNMPPLLLRTLEGSGRMGANVEQSRYTDYFIMAMRNWGLMDDPEFAERVTSFVRSMSGYERCFPDLLFLIVHRSPEEALKIVLDKNAGPGKVPIWETVKNFPHGFEAEIDIPNYVRFIRSVFLGPVTTEADRDSISFRISSFAGGIKDREITKEEAEALQELLDLLKGRREEVSDARLLRILNGGIRRLEEKLGK